jgi:hypothetical protein
MQELSKYNAINEKIIMKAALYDDSDCNNAVPRGRIATEASGRLSIYPNPSGQWIQIGGLADGEGYQIYDIHGRVIKSGVMTVGRIEDVSDLQGGVYILQGITSGQSQKFIKIQ